MLHLMACSVVTRAYSGRRAPRVVPASQDSVSPCIPELPDQPGAPSPKLLEDKASGAIYGRDPPPPSNHLRTYSSPVALNQGSLLIECRAEPEPPCWEPTSPSEGVSEPESGWLDTPLAAALLEAALKSARASPEGGLLESLAASVDDSSGRRSSLVSCPENRHYLYTCRVSPSSKEEE
jgi:hypothetical protein